uniref:cutinase family protein n=1 Tax=Nocardia suismassiliense TaxID=2077092 RepID=UPI003F490D09
MNNLTRWRRHLLHVALAATLVSGAAAQALTSTAAHAIPCAQVDLVVTRGTDEPGFLGAAVGDPLYAALQAVLPSITAYRVDYPANLLDPWSIGRGSADIVDHLTQQARACPGQRFVLAGYSQGALATHVALGTAFVGWLPGAVVLPAELGDRIAAVVLFGEPLRALGWHVPTPYADRTGNFCSPGDPICDRTGHNPTAHVAYGDHIRDAVQFTADRI